MSLGFSSSNGVQSDGATIQLARIFTGSAPCAAPVANRSVAANTHCHTRIRSLPWSCSVALLLATIAHPAERGLTAQLRPDESWFICYSRLIRHGLSSNRKRRAQT